MDSRPLQPLLSDDLTFGAAACSRHENWRDEAWAADPCDKDAEKSDSTTTSSTGGDAAEAETVNHSDFVSHKVSNLDTLAGLAIRYNVPISDIKRANGIIAENSMYAHQHLIIPIKGLPMREEIAMIFAQIAVRMGRDPVLDAENALHPATAAASRVARTLQLVGGVASTSGRQDSGGDDLWPSSICGLCADHGYSSKQKAQYVEMMERDVLEGNQYAAPSTAGVSRQLTHDPNLRKRAGASCANHGSYAPLRGAAHSTEPPSALMHSLSNRVAHGKGFFANLSQSISQSTFVQKIKHAATQPALAPAPTPRKPHSSTSGARPASVTGSPSVPVSYRAKDSAKDE